MLVRWGGNYWEQVNLTRVSVIRRGEYNCLGIFEEDDDSLEVRDTKPSTAIDGCPTWYESAYESTMRMMSILHCSMTYCSINLA